MCANINDDNFKTIHHEMGHIQYYMQYRNQTYLYRSGANPGFHEAIGDTMALAVLTPDHLRRIGLDNNRKNGSTNEEEKKKSNMNALMLMALKKLAFLPYGLLIDMWRWDIYSGKVKPDKYVTMH